MDLGPQSQAPDSQSRALPGGGPGHEGDGEKEAKCHLLVLSGNDRKPQGGHPFPLQHCQQCQHHRGALEIAPEGEGVLAKACWHPAWVGVLLGSPCWLEELASGALGSRIDLASCLHLQTPEESRVVLPTPLYHCLGSVGGTMVSMMHGVTLILSSPVFDGKMALETVSKERWASVGCYLLAHETLLSLTPGPRSLSRMSPPSSQEKGRQGSGAPQESISSCPQRTPACFPQWQPWPLL